MGLGIAEYRMTTTKRVRSFIAVFQWLFNLAKAIVENVRKSSLEALELVGRCIDLPNTSAFLWDVKSGVFCCARKFVEDVGYRTWFVTKEVRQVINVAGRSKRFETRQENNLRKEAYRHSYACIGHHILSIGHRPRSSVADIRSYIAKHDNKSACKPAFSI